MQERKHDMYCRYRQVRLKTAKYEDYEINNYIIRNGFISFILGM